MSSLRILHVAQPVSEGVAAISGDLMRFQVERGDEVHLASPSGPLVHGLPDGATWHDWKASRQPGWRVPGEVRRLSRIVREVDPDVVHLHSAKAGLCGRLVVRSRRVTLFQPHGWSFLATTGLQAVLARTWERWGARWTSAVVCVSADEEATGYDAGIKPRRYVQRRNAVRLESYGSISRMQAREVLGLPPDELLVLSVARLTHQKGIDLLLDAWERVRGHVPPARLLIVGGGSEGAFLRARASRFPEVAFLGARDDVALWYSACDLFVLSSRYEGMAVTPLEAMASERPVVGFDVAGLAECIGSVQAPCPVVPAEDTRSLAEAITLRLGDARLRADEGRRNLHQVRAHHGLTSAGEGMTELYEQLVYGA